jgi:hypothetical protein
MRAVMMMAMMVMVMVVAMVLMSVDVDAVSLILNETKVVSVTIFGSGMSEVTRSVMIQESLPAGLHSVTVAGLSSFLDERSLEITGVGRAEILDIKMTVLTSSREKDAGYQSLLRDLRSQLEELPSQVTSANSKVDVILEKSHMFRAYVKSLFDCTSNSSAAFKTAEEAFNMLDSQETQLNKMNEDVRKQIKLKEKLNAEMVYLRTEIQNLQQSGMYTDRNGSHHVFDTVNERSVSFQFKLESATSFPTQLFLSYFITPASWVAEYDVRVGEPIVNADGGRVEYNVQFDYFANVNQHTGEDWDDIDLALSTSNPKHTSPLALPALISRGVYFESIQPERSIHGRAAGQPTNAPTVAPSRAPTAAPSASPSSGPSASPRSGSNADPSARYTSARNMEDFAEFGEFVTQAASSASSSGDMSASYLFKIPYKVNVTNIDSHRAYINKRQYGAISVPRHRLLIDKVSFSATLFTFAVPSTRTGAFLRLWSKLPAHSSTSLLDSPSARIFIEVRITMMCTQN